MEAICYLLLRALPQHMPFLIAVLNIDLLFLFCRKSEDGTQEGKKAFVKNPDLHLTDPGQAPKTEQKADACLPPGTWDRTTYNSWQTWLFPKIAVDRIAAARGSWPQSRMTAWRWRRS